jgi:hypothetical protein
MVMEHAMQAETVTVILATVAQIVQHSAPMSVHTMVNALKEHVCALPASLVLIVPFLAAAAVMVVVRMTHQHVYVTEDGVEPIAPSELCAQTCCAQATDHVLMVSVNACLALMDQYVLLWEGGVPLPALHMAFATL